MESSDIPNEAPATGDETVPSRRKMLALGAVGVSAALTIRPAFAQTAVSVMNCQIPVPDASAAGRYIDAAGKLVPPGTQGAFPGAPRPFTGEEVAHERQFALSSVSLTAERARHVESAIRRCGAPASLRRFFPNPAARQ